MKRKKIFNQEFCLLNVKNFKMQKYLFYIYKQDHAVGDFSVKLININFV